MTLSWFCWCIQLYLLAAVSVVRAAPSVRAVLSPYTPVTATCPTTPLIRTADGISTAERQYWEKRYPRAASGLRTWLSKAGASFQVKKYPTVALITSGGGYRSLLVGAGVIQAFDDRDSNAVVGGIYKTLTYQAGLSGGAWLLSSFAGNGYPTITSLKNGLWADAFQRSLLVPVNLQAPESADAYAEIVADIVAKDAAGFPPTLTDPWGRLLSYQLLYGPDGGAGVTISDIASGSNFSAYDVPFPIITARGVDATKGQCTPPGDATQYEFTPYEFGSWDRGVHAFSQVAYLGSSLSNGQPTSPTGCTMNYDNLGYVFGTSSHLFNEACAVIPPSNSTKSLAPNLEVIINKIRSSSFRDLFAVYPNPFFNSPNSNAVSNQKELYLVDGGLGDPNPQNDPIWPFLHRPLTDVLIVNDNSADTQDNFPNGTAIRSTYLEAQNANLKRMPFIPPIDEIVAKGLTKRPAFFGCNDASKLTIIYIPNVNYTYPSNQPTLKLQYSVAETNSMIANGFNVATKNGDPNWPVCLACGIMKKAVNTEPSKNLPTAAVKETMRKCAACFTQYCYN